MLKAIPKPQRVIDKDYIEFIKTIPCIICSLTGLYSPSNPHHENKKGEGGIGTKTSDYRAIPLCTPHHNERHQIGTDSFATKYNINYEEIISRLNKMFE